MNLNFDFNALNIQITVEEILCKISEFDIFKKYCNNFIEIDKAFTSTLRIDKHSDCRIYINKDNRLFYKDFATGEHLSCFNYVAKKFNCTYYEALNIIAGDFKIKELKYNFKEIPIGTTSIRSQVNYIKEKSRIEIIDQNWSLTDHNYWSQYGITFDLLNEYQVFSAKYVYLYKRNKRWIFEYKKNNPSYAYRFTNNGNYSYKVYWPLHKEKNRKWLFSGTDLDLEGYDQLPLNGDLLILSKSLKDVMVLNMLGYSAISLQGEGNKLYHDTKNSLMKRFSNIISFYDQDLAGHNGANYLFNSHNILSIFIPEKYKIKDISDFVKIKGFEKGKKLVYKLLNEKV